MLVDITYKRDTQGVSPYFPMTVGFVCNRADALACSFRLYTTKATQKSLFLFIYGSNAESKYRPHRHPALTTLSTGDCHE